MKITKQILKQIILEELQELSEGGPGSGMKLPPAELKARQRQRDDADVRARRLKSFQGGRELMSIAKGITEEDEENCSVGNPSHDKETGEFTSADKAGSWSIKKKGKNCKSGQYSKRYGGKDTSVCGRDNQYKSCATGQIKEDEDDSSQEGQDYQGLHYEHAKLKMAHKELTAKHNKVLAYVEKLKKQITTQGQGMSWDTCLQTIDKVERAAKGDLNKPLKK